MNMKRSSAFLAETGDKKVTREKSLCMIYGAVLFLSGFLVLMFPAHQTSAWMILSVSWILFFALILSVLRSVLYPRGIADVVMSIMAGLFYGLASWGASGPGVDSILGFRTILSVTLIFTGFSRFLAFARILSEIQLPLLIAGGFADLIAGFFMLFGFPDTRSLMIYWYIGMLMLLSSAEVITEARILNHIPKSSPA